MMMDTKIWGYRPESQYNGLEDLRGFLVETTDARIGEVEMIGSEGGSGGAAGAYLVICLANDTGPGHPGRRVVLPAGVVALVDLASETVLVDGTRQQIMDAPDLDQVHRRPELDYLCRLGGYYASFQGGRH
ncbi:hypothetical protein ABIA32_006493 [Streptacidiphilus sp. MAP12-20]|uniref:PRC-barrel domain containing protein n=1 Tax=Streptacidiphilus sp. MAP12-20 TaxID=3156299 RepID=UPI00351429B9